MQTNKTYAKSGCPFMMNRRSFLATAGAMAAATKLGLLDFTSSLFAAESKPVGKPLIRAAFVRPNVDRTWLGWPGTAYDINTHQRQYTKVLTDAAKKFGIDMEVVGERLHDSNSVNTFLENLKKNTPDGILITCMNLNMGLEP